MKKILQNMDSAVAGEKPAAPAEVGSMKAILESLHDVSDKEVVNEAATITVSAETGAEVADMIAALQANAGMKPTAKDMPIQGAHIDDPDIPGKDDVPGDVDLKAGALGALAGGLGGSALGKAVGDATGIASTLAAKGGELGAKAGGWAADKLGKGMVGKMAYKAAGSKLGSKIGQALPSVAGGYIGAKVGDKFTDDYDNEPNPEYSDHEKMTHDLSGGINREKKMAKAANRGDNAMAVESIKDRLWAALNEKKAKKDYDGDGKIETPKDEYMGSKDKAIKKAMAKKK